MPSPNLASSLPDLPRWSEIRATLLAGRAAPVGPVSLDPLSFVVLQADGALAGVVGAPPDDAIRTAAAGAKELLASADNVAKVSAALPGWNKEQTADEVWVFTPPNEGFDLETLIGAFIVTQAWRPKRRR